MQNPCTAADVALAPGGDRQQPRATDSSALFGCQPASPDRCQDSLLLLEAVLCPEAFEDNLTFRLDVSLGPSAADPRRLAEEEEAFRGKIPAVQMGAREATAAGEDPVSAYSSIHLLPRVSPGCDPEQTSHGRSVSLRPGKPQQRSERSTGLRSEGTRVRLLGTIQAIPALLGYLSLLWGGEGSSLSIRDITRFVSPCVRAHCVMMELLPPDRTE